MAVLEVQEKCIDMCTSKYSLADIYKEMLELLGQHLIQLGILAKMDNKHHFTQVSGFLYHCDPLYFTYFPMKLAGLVSQVRCMVIRSMLV